MEVTAVGSFFSGYAKEIISICVPFALWFLNRQFQPSAKLYHSIRHTFRFLVPEPLRNKDGEVLRPNQTVHVASVSVTNTGRKTAKPVEITFNWKPMHINVWPHRHFETKDAPDGRHTVVLESLAPKEIFGMELLSINADLPAICNVRSEQIESVERAMILQIVQPQRVLVFVAWLMLLGAIGTVYLLLLLIEAAVS
jgi:hypothetical protein